MASKSKASIAEAVENLRGFVKPGDTVYTILRHVSGSGMSRRISLLTIKGEDIRQLDRMAIAADLGRRPRDEYADGVVVGGCGMDMGFHLVYNLGRLCFPDGFGTPCVHCGYRFASKAESDTYCEGVPSPVPCASPMQDHLFRGRNGDDSGWDNDGGYALNHRWL